MGSPFQEYQTNQAIAGGEFIVWIEDLWDDVVHDMLGILTHRPDHIVISYAPDQ